MPGEGFSYSFFLSFLQHPVGLGGSGCAPTRVLNGFWRTDCIGPPLPLLAFQPAKLCPSLKPGMPAEWLQLELDSWNCRPGSWLDQEKNMFSVDRVGNEFGVWLLAASAVCECADLPGYKI
eukprot:1161676-Pelagomonas_calceolata.AAC.15